MTQRSLFTPCGTLYTLSTPRNITTTVLSRQRERERERSGKSPLGDPNYELLDHVPDGSPVSPQRWHWLKSKRADKTIRSSEVVERGKGGEEQVQQAATTTATTRRACVVGFWNRLRRIANQQRRDAVEQERRKKRKEQREIETEETPSSAIIKRNIQQDKSFRRVNWRAKKDCW